MNEAIKDRGQVNLIVNNRADGNVPLIAERFADRLHKERRKSLSNYFDKKLYRSDFISRIVNCQRLLTKN